MIEQFSLVLGTLRRARASLPRSQSAARRTVLAGSAVKRHPPPGGAIALTESGATALGGRLPVNVSGGLVARGHPVGATGVAQIAEIAEQIMGRAGARQVEGARVGLAQMAGGLLGRDSAVAAVHILVR